MRKGYALTSSYKEKRLHGPALRVRLRSYPQSGTQYRFFKGDGKDRFPERETRPRRRGSARNSPAENRRKPKKSPENLHRKNQNSAPKKMGAEMGSKAKNRRKSSKFPKKQVFLRISVGFKSRHLNHGTVYCIDFHVKHNIWCLFFAFFHKKIAFLGRNLGRKINNPTSRSPGA